MVRNLALALVLALAACPQPGQGSYFAHPLPYGQSPGAPTPRPAAHKPVAADDALLADCRNAIASSKSLVASILAVKGVRAVDNTVEPYNDIERQLDTAGEWSDLVAAVHSDGKMRDAAHTCSQEVTQMWGELWLDHRIYDALKSVDISLADPETKRFVAIVLRDMKRSGVELDDKGRTRVREIDAQIASLARDFSKHLADDVRTVDVTDPARLAGLPADWLAAHKPDASGTVKITTDFADYVRVLTYADDDALRKELYIAFRSRGDAKNEQVLHDVLVLRAEKALLFGFASWADYASDDRMLRGGKTASDFLERLQRIAAPRARKDYAELLAQLKTHDPKATEVTEWQKAWLENQLRRDKYAVDSAEVRKYFNYGRTVVGLFELAGTAFDVEFSQTTDARTWAADVKVFDVVRKGEKLGRVFLDMHPRAHKLVVGAHVVAPGVKGAQLPEVALVMAVPEGALDHHDVVAMFHELEKAMHLLLAGRHHFVRQSGLPGERDFADAPALAFEDSAFNYDVLAKFAKSDTGEVIPKDLVEKLRRADRFGRGTALTTQLLYAAVALRFHQDDPSKLDQAAVFKQLQKKYLAFAFVDGTKPHASFEHLVSYSALYYTYLSSFALARDLLTAGKPMTPMLEAGGTKEAADLVKDYLGRGSGTKAFEKYVGESP
jgi:thimet oligopeptidase